MDQTTEGSIEFLNIISIFISMMSENGKLITKMGELEKKYPKEFSLMKDFSAERVQEFIDKAPPEIAGLFLKILLRTTTIAPKMSNAMNLPADEKIKLGEQIGGLVKDLEALLEKVKEETKE